jgi:formylglycine-generating enzyme required for sulfatase activity
MLMLRFGPLSVVYLFALTACAQSGTVAHKAAWPIEDAAQRLVTRIQGQLVKLPPGTFEMGDWGNAQGLPYDAEPDSKPLHEVKLDGFAMMAFKVTYEDFDVFTEAVGSPKINLDVERFKPGARNAKRPATVNWFGAKAFCQWVGMVSGKPFDLPTEAQWEYAARSGGKKLIFATDNGNLDEGRNYPSDDYRPRLLTPEVGLYPPNPAGLYGMLDYAADEWVNDWYQPNYYKYSPKANPAGPENGAMDERIPEFGPRRVVRGLIASSPGFGGFTFSRAGRWPYARDFSSKARRLFTEPAYGYSNPAGPQFRCVLNLTEQATPKSNK